MIWLSSGFEGSLSNTTVQLFVASKEGLEAEHKAYVIQFSNLKKSWSIMALDEAIIDTVTQSF